MLRGPAPIFCDLHVSPFAVSHGSFVFGSHERRSDGIWQPSGATSLEPKQR
jgi:hypothetical protein